MNLSVEDFIEQYPSDTQAIMFFLRKIILESSPKIVENIKFKIPFYTYYGMIFYINPTKEGVDLGFCQGKELSDNHHFLEIKNRKQVKTISFKSINTVPEEDLRAVIQEALIINEIKAQARLKKKLKG